LTLELLAKQLAQIQAQISGIETVGTDSSISPSDSSDSSDSSMTTPTPTLSPSLDLFDSSMISPPSSDSSDLSIVSPSALPSFAPENVPENASESQGLTVIIPDESRFTEDDQVEYGEVGEKVEKLQRFLEEEDYFDANKYPYGYFGNITKNSLANWQKDNGISVENRFYGSFFGPLSIDKANQVSQQDIDDLVFKLKSQGFTVSQLSSQSTTATRTPFLPMAPPVLTSPPPPPPPRMPPKNPFIPINKTIHLAFREGSNIKYGKWDGVNSPVFNTVDFATLISGVYGLIDTTLDASGDHHLVYLDLNNQLRYKLNFNPIVPIGALAKNVAIAVDDNNKTVYVAAVSPNDEIFIAKKVSNNWISATIKDANNNTFKHRQYAEFELFLDTSQNPTLLHVIYYDNTFATGSRVRQLTIDSNFAFKSNKPTISYDTILFNVDAEPNRTSNNLAFVYKGLNNTDFLAESSNNWSPKAVFTQSQVWRPALKILGPFRWVLTDDGSNLNIFSSLDGGKTWRNKSFKSIGISADADIDFSPPIAAFVYIEYPFSMQVGYLDNFLFNDWKIEKIYDPNRSIDNLNIETQHIPN